MYPFFYTKPVDIVTDNTFLNSLAVVLTAFSPVEVKQELNKIELFLGRDRSDPQCSTKDRSADIDVLGCEDAFDENVFKRYPEPYVSNLIGASARPVDLSTFNLPVTKGAATVDFDARSGHIRILDDTAQRLEYWHKAAFSTQ